MSFKQLNKNSRQYNSDMKHSIKGTRGKGTCNSSKIQIASCYNINSVKANRD